LSVLLAQISGNPIAFHNEGRRAVHVAFDLYSRGWLSRAEAKSNLLLQVLPTSSSSYCSFTWRFTNLFCPLLCNLRIRTIILLKWEKNFHVCLRAITCF